MNNEYWSGLQPDHHTPDHLFYIFILFVQKSVQNPKQNKKLQVSASEMWEFDLYYVLFNGRFSLSLSV